MKSRHLHLILLGFLSFTFAMALAPRVSAQTLFQNNNTACQNELVICDSTMASCSGDAVSVACKNIEGPVDFDGNGFGDCVVSGSVSRGTDEQIVSVLLNTGLTDVDCVGGMGNQFNASEDHSIERLNMLGELSSVVAGDLGGMNFDDFALANIQLIGDPPSASVFTSFSLPGGGFGPDESLIPLAQSSAALWVPPSPLMFTGFSPLQSEKNMVLFDCDADGDLDNVIASQLRIEFGNTEALGAFGIINRNDGNGLVSVDDMTLPGSGTGIAGFAPPDFPPPQQGEFLVVSLAVADFNGDDALDIIAAVRSQNPAGPPSYPSQIRFCANDGACGFPDECVLAVDLLTESPEMGVDPQPFSIAAEDFNGDGFADVVVSTPGLSSSQRGVQYFFGNGDGSFQTPGVFVNFPGEPYSAGGTPRAITTGCFNNDNVVDVAVVGNSVGTDGPSDVRVVTSDGAGGLNPALQLRFADTGLFQFGNGIDAADFDNQGGDDIMALAGDFQNQDARNAYIFLNTVEQIIAEAGPDQQVTLNTPTAITGASCSLEPDNPADPATFAINWTISPTAGATLTDVDRLDPTLNVTTEGTYTLTLECRTRCDEVVTDTKVVTVGTVPPPPGPVLTQGGNFFCSLNKAGGPAASRFGVALILLALGGLLAWRFRKGFGLMVLALTLLTGLAGNTHALTNSVSVNTFRPTMDDSDYITVYSSPTMLKRNYHVGFFLDYAYRPYEFGNADFDRVSGIVDHLLDANIVGSYGVLDWLTIGVDIPVHLYESLDSPLLGLDESNFALGDVELYFKFRLLDREQRGVGISVIPFARFPTSTNSADFLGDGSFGGGGLVVIDGKFADRVTVALNLGYNIRGKFIDVGGNEINDEFLASLGISGEVIKGVFRIIGELQTATVVNDFYSSQRTTPMEGRVGFRYTWANNHDINAGVGLGILHGIGQPAIRGFVGYTYTKRPIAEVTVPPPPMNEIQVGDELTLQDKIYFDFDRSTIRDISKPTLDKIAGFLKAHPEVTKIKIDGYTCDLGTDRYNMGLSQRRANSVRQYLIGQEISPSRIGTVQGYGEANPLVPNTSETNREQNRRVQIFVEAVDNSLINTVTPSDS